MVQVINEIRSRPTNNGRCHCFDAEWTRREFLSKASYLAIAALFSADGRAKDADAFPLSVISGNLEGAECSYGVPSSNGVGIDSDNQVILVRNANCVYAFALACPHENTALRWRPRDGYFLCPRHQAKYQPDGGFLSGRATRNMDRFSVRLEGQKIIVDLNRLYRSDEQKAEWQSAFVTV